MEGSQVILIDGYLKNSKIMKVGPNDSSLFTATIAIPANDVEGRYQNLQIASFTCADELAEYKNGSPVHIEGHLEIKTSVGTCSQCGHKKTQYWTNIIVDSVKPI